MYNRVCTFIRRHVDTARSRVKRLRDRFAFKKMAPKVRVVPGMWDVEQQQIDQRDAELLVREYNESKETTHVRR